MNIKLNCSLQKKVSKNGREFYVIYIEDLAKYVFLSDTELKLIKLLFSNENTD